MMTKKHFKLIANSISTASHMVVGEAIYIDKNEVVNKLVAMCAEENPNFNRKKFLEACGIEED